MEKKSIEVIVGKEPTGAVDESKVAKGVAVPPKSRDEVGGRARLAVWVECPYCWANNYIIEDTDVYRYYQCWNCNRYFTA
jgi:hypothetical protein